MAGWRWPRAIGEILLIVLPLAVTIVFVTLDVFGVAQVTHQRLGWREFALISIGIAVVVIMVDLSRLMRRVWQLEDAQAILEITPNKEMIMGEWARRPQEMDWHRIRVHNASKTVQATDVVVKLHSIDPNPLELNPCPGRLGIKGGDPNTANPGDDLLFDFVRDTKRGTLNLWTVEFQGQEFIPQNVDYIATFSISAGNAPLVFKKFKMRQPMRRDENNYLWMDGDLEFTLLPDEAEGHDG
jgi:hypothetical protein